MLSLGVVLALAGFTFLLLALRGRRIDTHPTCRRCRFDLVGVPESTRCPECGAELSQRRAIRTGNRRRVPRRVALSVLLLLVGLGSVGIPFWARARGFNWNTVKPEWWLAADSRSNDIAVSDAAIAEFTRRLDAAELSRPRAESVIIDALGRQTDPGASWSMPWGNFLERARTAELLSPEQLASYARHVPALSCTGRSTGVQGGRWSPTLRVGGSRAGQGTSLRLSARLIALEIDSEPQYKPPVGPGDSSLGLDPGGRSALRTQITIAAAPGKRTARARWSFAVRDGFGESQPPLATWEEDFTLPLEVLPAGSTTVKLYRDESLRAAIERSIRTYNNTVTGKDASGAINIDSPPAPMAFRIWWRYADPSSPGGSRELDLGAITVAAGNSSNGFGFGASVPDGAEFTAVDVVLRPDPIAAEESEDLTEIWDGQIILPAIPVKRIDPSTGG